MYDSDSCKGISNCKKLGTLLMISYSKEETKNRNICPKGRPLI